MTLKVTGTLEISAKVQYICTLVGVEAIRKSDSLSADAKSANTLTVEDIILGLGLYFSY